MARVIAGYGLDMSNLSLNRLLAYTDTGFYNDQNIEINGRTYQDLFYVDWTYNQASFRSYFGGTDITFNAFGGISGGTITGYLETVWNGANYVIAGGLEDVSIAATEIWAAALTASSSDDDAVYSAALNSHDDLYGSNDADVLLGFAGNDTFYATTGNDQIDGGAGTDVYSATSLSRSDVSVTTTSNGYAIVSAYGTDQLNSIETVALSDGTFAIDELLVGAESEDNQYNNLTLGQTMVASLATSDDVDWFRISVDSAQILEFEFDAPFNSSYSDYYAVGLYTADSEILAYGWVGGDAYAEAYVPEAGDYYVRIATDSNTLHTSQNYSLTARSVTRDYNLEVESNGSETTATQLIENQTTRGQLAGTSDVDVYQISMNAAGLVSFSFDSPYDDLYTPYFDLRVTDANDVVYAGGQTGTDIVSEVYLPGAGEYFVQVESSDYWYTDEQYGLSYQQVTRNYAVESESNDTAATANALTLGNQIQGQLSSVEDLDVFSFNLSASSIVNFVFDSPENDAYADYFEFSVFDASGTMFGGAATGQDASAEIFLPSAGEYYVSVGSDDYWYSGLQYGLTASLVDRDYDMESEGNETFQTADALVLGREMRGQLSSVDDLDAYRFSVSGPQLLEFTFDSPIESPYAEYFTFFVVDIDNNVFGQTSTGVSGSAEIYLPEAGDYYLGIVSDSYWYTDLQYGITANAVTRNYDFESESNNTLATANTLTLDREMRAQLSSYDDEDVFSFAIMGQSIVEFDFDSPVDSYYADYFEFTVTDSDGVVYGEAQLGTDATGEVALPDAGTYYLTVNSDSYWYTGDQYGVTASVVTRNYELETESNDTNADANTLTLGQAMRGQLGGDQDIDVYALSLSANQTIEFAFDSPVDSVYADYFKFTVTDAQGNVHAAAQTGQDDQIDVYFQDAGTYYLSVESDAYWYTDEQYEITATAVTRDYQLETESNNTQTTADAVTLDQEIRGQLRDASDVDVYSMTVSSAGVGVISFDVAEDGYFDQYILDVYDSQGTLLSSRGVSGDIDYEVAVSSAGTYYLEVHSSYYYHTSDSYGLTISAEAPSDGDRESEPNDTYANLMASGVSKVGNLSTAYDIDWFYLNVANPSDFDIDWVLPSDAVEGDFALYVLDADFNYLYGDSVTSGEDISVSGNTAGDYYFGLTSWYSHNDSDYEFTVTATEGTPVPTESEQNGTIATADTLAVNGAILGELSSSSDVDIYRFNSGSATEFNAMLDIPWESAWDDLFQVRLLDASGTEIGVRRFGADYAENLQVTANTDYYLELSWASIYEPWGQYRLSLDAIVSEERPNDAIVGTDLGDALNGTASDDDIYGLGGYDIINGAAGTDTAHFESSADYFAVSNVEGITRVEGRYSAGNYAGDIAKLYNVESLEFIDGTQSLSTADVTPIFGTLERDFIAGTSGADLIDGRGGNDWIDGGAGSDTLALFGTASDFDVITLRGLTQIKGTESEYEGTTSLVWSVETLAFAQGDDRTLSAGTGELVVGSEFDDALTGSASADVFYTLGGDDDLYGRGGEDSLVIFGRSADYEVSYLTDDDDFEAQVLHTASGDRVRLNSVEEVVFTDTVLEIDQPASISVDLSTSWIEEGGDDSTLSITLSKAPTQDVTITLTTNNQLDATPETLTFTSSNWSVAQTSTISAADDESNENAHTGTVTVSVTSEDAEFGGLQSQQVTLNIVDNDEVTTGSLSGRVWVDRDGDGELDAGEGGMSGWMVYRDDNANGAHDDGEASVLTDAQGHYTFSNLDPGTYTVRAEDQAGWVNTLPGQGQSGPTVISPSYVSGTASTQATFTPSDADNFDKLGLSTNVDDYYQDSRFSEYDGSGQAVVIIDTGADLDHPFFGPDSDGDGVADRIVYQYDFVGGNDDSADDENGHGTHVAGTAASSDALFPGIAPGADLIVLRVLGEGGGSFGDIREALEWAAANVSVYNIASVNMSLGIPDDFDTSPVEGSLHSALRSLHSQGVVTVSASGNDYAGSQGVSYPSSDPYSLSVGAVLNGNQNFGSAQSAGDDAIAYFSQRDDELSDIFAPGARVNSAWLNGGTNNIQGTSMAAPQIAGMVAVIQSVAEGELGRRLTPDEIETVMKDTAVDIVDGDDENDSVANTDLTFQRVDLLAMAEAVLEFSAPNSYEIEVVVGENTTGADFGFVNAETTTGTASSDQVFGSAAGEQIAGAAGDDRIYGGDGDDRLIGDEGDDVIVGGQGADELTGGEGEDQFVYQTLDDLGDQITDFNGDEDSFDVTNIVTRDDLSTQLFTEVVTWSEDGDDVNLQLNTDGETSTIATLQNVDASDVTISSFDGFDWLASPRIIGTLSINSDLRAALEGVTDAAGDFSYQWYRDGEIIDGATSSSYTVTTADADLPLTLQVSYTNTDGDPVQMSADPVTIPSAVIVQILDGQSNSITAGSFSVSFGNTELAAELSSAGLSFDTTQIGVGQTFRIESDVDAGDAIGISDVIGQLRHIVGLSELDGLAETNADVDGNGSVGISDVISNLRVIVGLEDAPTARLVDAEGQMDLTTDDLDGSLYLSVAGDVDLSFGGSDLV